jgi:hypothetical protein
MSVSHLSTKYVTVVVVAYVHTLSHSFVVVYRLDQGYAAI